MNNVNQQKTQFCNIQAKRPWRKAKRKTIGEVIRAIMLSSVVVASTIAIPTQAAVIDREKMNVEGLKKDTSVIKIKAKDIQNRVKEISSTTHAQISETIEIRSALDPLFLMRKKFDEWGLDSTELLENVNDEEAQAMIAKLRQQKLEAQVRLNDPDLESFRVEFIDVLKRINKIVTDQGAIPKVSALQMLVEKASLPVLAIIKKAAGGPVLSRLQGQVISVTEAYSQLQERGVFNAIELANISSVDEELVCGLVAQAKSVTLALWYYDFQLTKLIGTIEEIKNGVPDVEKKDLTIHGWLKIISFDPAGDLNRDLKKIKGRLESKQKNVEIAESLIDWGRDFGECKIVI